MHATPVEPLSRRELNRRATASAIAQAVQTLAQQQEWSSVTVEQVAAAAQISRRTFFNYYRSLEEALNSPLQAVIESAAASMATDDTSGLDVLARLVEGISDAISLELLEPAARVLLLGRESQTIKDAQLAAWEQCVELLMPPELPTDTGTSAVRLYISTLVRAAIGAAQAAFHHWADGLERPLRESDVERLRTTIADSIGLLRDGFALPSWLTEAELLACQYQPPSRLA